MHQFAYYAVPLVPSLNPNGCLFVLYRNLKFGRKHITLVWIQGISLLFLFVIKCFANSIFTFLQCHQSLYKTFFSCLFCRIESEKEKNFVQCCDIFLEIYFQCVNPNPFWHCFHFQIPSGWNIHRIHMRF